jgi:hypothetical protein
MNDEGLADAAAANPFALPRLHPGIGWRPGQHVTRGEPLLLTWSLGPAMGRVYLERGFSKNQLVDA